MLLCDAHVRLSQCSLPGICLDRPAVEVLEHVSARRSQIGKSSGGNAFGGFRVSRRTPDSTPPPAGSPTSASPVESRSSAAIPTVTMSAEAPSPDPRIGLRGGAYDAAEAVWNMRVLSKTKPSEQFLTGINSDLAFSGNNVFQGSFNGWQVWDISNPRQPKLRKAYVCPGSQSDVSVYRNLLVVSGEDLGARLDCGTGGVKDSVSKDRLRGVRIFDISDIDNPKNVGNVQTCRGSHTHSLLVDPKDPNNVYVYISGSSGVRSPSELAGCVNLSPDKDPNSALFRIEVIKVPLANPEQAAIVTSPRIFTGLVEAPAHGETALDKAEHAKEVAAAKARGSLHGGDLRAKSKSPPTASSPCS